MTGCESSLELWDVTAEAAYSERCGRVVTHRAVVGLRVFYVCADHAHLGDIPLHLLPALF